MTLEVAVALSPLTFTSGEGREANDTRRSRILEQVLVRGALQPTSVGALEGGKPAADAALAARRARDCQPVLVLVLAGVLVVAKGRIHITPLRHR